MTEKHEPGTVVFDPSAVAALTGDVGDDAFAPVFVGKFRALLPERVRRIAITLGSDDVDDALDAVLSLKVSACAVGAGELCRIGRTLEAHLRHLDLANGGHPCLVQTEDVGTTFRVRFPALPPAAAEPAPTAASS